MPRVQKTTGSETFVRGAGRFEVGDEADVDAEMAAYLVDERGDFDYVDGPPDDAPSEEDGPPDDTGDNAEADDAGDDEFDVDAFLDRTPVSDVADGICAGEADDHLDAVQEAAERVTVQDAVGERRAELATEE